MMDEILHFIMMSKLKHPEVFITESWKEIWEHWDELSDIDKEYYLSLRTVTRIFDVEN